MKRKNMARNALFTSIISLLLCVSMLVGTTFAWFTDTVTSGNNVIASGNLDIELDYATFDENGSFKEWKSVGGSDKLFDDKTLWEPGHTEVVYLRMSNAGSLDLKYQLGINITETTGTNVYNETFKLSDYIWMSVVNGVNAEKAAFATREMARQEAEKGTNGIIGKGYSKPGSMMSGDPDIYMAVVVYMPESVDNHANHLTGTAAPVITLGINLFATQIESEIDSFGPDYDGGAPWITAAAIDWYLDALDENPDATEFTITSAEDLAGLAAIVNGTATVDMATYATENTVTTIQDSFKDKTIKLGADIDLANCAWTPIGNASNGFCGTFDGNGHTIFNLNVSGTTSVGLFGYALNGGNVKNLTVKNATVKGNDYAGVIMGRGYTDIDKCRVENATVITVPYLTSNGIYDGGAKAGGVIGQLLEGADNTVTNCYVENVKIYGFRDIGGVVGMVHNNNSCSGNSSSNVTLGYVLCDQITADKNENAGLIYGRVQPSATVSPTKDSAENTPTKMDYMAPFGTSLNGAVSSGANVTLGSGDFTLPSMADMEGVTIVGADDGSTVIGGSDASTGYASNFGKDTTIKNVTFAGSSNGVRWSYANGGTSTFDNCTFAGDSTYGFHIDQSNGAAFVFNNCTFIGFNAFAGDLESVTFNNCTFKSNGNYGHTNIWSKGYFKNCTWEDNTSVSPAGSGKLYFNDVEESYHHEFIGSAESLFAFAKSVNEDEDSWTNQKVLLVNDIDLKDAAWTPIGQTGATQFKGIFDGQNFTIKNLNINASKQTGANYSSGLFGWLNKATVKNLSVENATVTGNHNVGVIAGYMETTGCTITNCHVEGATVVAKHANDDACGDKVGVIVGHAGNAGVKVENCSAKGSTVTAGRDAGQIAGAALNANVVGCSAENVTVTATGDCTGANINNAVIGRVLG